jgi:hypothetical protein
MKNVDTQIAISDLGLASLLVTLNFNLVDMERVNEKRINFLFAPAEGIEQVISDFWAGIKISVSTQSLFNNQKMLKNRLYAFK